MNRSANFLHLESRLIKETGTAIVDYQMIEEGDHVMVCLSGGKDSYSMLSLLRLLQQRAPISFTLTAVNVDQKQPNFPEHVLPQYLTKEQVPFRIVEQDTYSIVKEKIPEGKTTCSLCSRLRRGILYRTAEEIGANKIALGHHREDTIETLFLNMFFGGRLKGMAPKLLSDTGEHVVIRPLVYCAERDIASYARLMQYPIIPCDLCGSQENLQRQKVKEMLAQWEKDSPGRIQNIARSLRTVVPSHLGDTDLFDFRTLRSNPVTDDAALACGDTADRAVLEDLIPLRFFERDAMLLK
jgi:tRNA 2-thiocytidine biosynthesis protein TtcA